MISVSLLSLSVPTSHSVIPISNVSPISQDSCNIAALSFCSPLATLVRRLIAHADADAAAWPPQEHSIYPEEDDPDHQLVLPESPWTYKSESFNPNLTPSNARRRITRTNRQAPANSGHSALPPYHPDYEEGGDVPFAPDSSDEDDYYDEGPAVRVRRGSEGYEVKPVAREDMLRQYVYERTTEPGRYNVYEPDEPSEEDSDEEVSLQERVDEWRSSSA